jgi:hypothetical protein
MGYPFVEVIKKSCAFPHRLRLYLYLCIYFDLVLERKTYMARGILREFSVNSTDDFNRVEQYICAELKKPAHACSFLRASSFIQLRIAVLYRDPSANMRDIVATSDCGTVTVVLVQRSRVVQVHTRGISMFFPRSLKEAISEEGDILQDEPERKPTKRKSSALP